MGNIYLLIKPIHIEEDVKMKIQKYLFTSFFAMVFGALSCLALAVDKIDADDFVDKASSSGVAEIENAKLALEKSKSTSVRTFAQKVITDHTAANAELGRIAGQKNLKLSGDESLVAKAKNWALDLRDDSFDKAYAENQVTSHENSVELFERAAASDDAEIAAFARKTLPTLKAHLDAARNLVNQTDRDSNNRGNNSSSYHSLNHSSASSVPGNLGTQGTGGPAGGTTGGYPSGTPSGSNSSL